MEDVHSYAGPADLGLRRACLSPISSFVRWRAFFIIELHSRKVIHVDVTRSPTDAWTAQQLREATPYGQGPKYLIRDRDNKFGLSFARVAATSGIKILKTPYHAPRANAICERFLGSVRRECLDHLLILQDKQLHRVLRTYIQLYWLLGASVPKQQEKSCLDTLGCEVEKEEKIGCRSSSVQFMERIFQVASTAGSVRLVFEGMCQVANTGIFASQPMFALFMVLSRGWQEPF